MKVKVFSQEGKELGREIELSDEIFGIEPNDHAVWLAIRQHQAALHQGTHKSKERWEIARTTKKAFRQKGTGGARRGDMKSPLVRGGARVFGPKPHSYDFKINKKVKDIAKKSAFAYKAKESNIIVVDNLTLSGPKTKDFISLLNGLNVSDVKSLILISEPNQNIFLSSRNIPKTTVIEATQVGIYDVMNANKVIITEAAIKELEANLSNNN
jgi:large subunit ribosomal protein L4